MYSVAFVVSYVLRVSVLGALLAFETYLLCVLLVVVWTTCFMCSLCVLVLVMWIAVWGFVVCRVCLRLLCVLLVV